MNQNNYMKKIYQRVVSGEGKGDCVSAAVASILDKEYEEVPDMSPKTGNQMSILMKFMLENGYKYKKTLYNKKYHILHMTDQYEYCKKGHSILDEYVITENNLSNFKGVNGLFLATVLSPKYFDLNSNKWGHHQVICDSKLNIVFDPGPDYSDLVNYPLADLIGCNGICIIDIFEKI